MASSSTPTRGAVRSNSYLVRSLPNSPKEVISTLPPRYNSSGLLRTAAARSPQASTQSYPARQSAPLVSTAVPSFRPLDPSRIKSAAAVPDKKGRDDGLRVEEANNGEVPKNPWWAATPDKDEPKVLESGAVPTNSSTDDVQVASTATERGAQELPDVVSSDPLQPAASLDAEAGNPTEPTELAQPEACLLDGVVAPPRRRHPPPPYGKTQFFEDGVDLDSAIADASPEAPRYGPDGMPIGETTPFAAAPAGPEPGLDGVPIGETPPPLAAPAGPQLALAGDVLDLVMAPGDLLVVRGRGGISMIGTTGGFMGHVLVVLGTPRQVWQASPEAEELEAIWPADIESVWRIHTLESTRREKGLWEAEMVVHVDRMTREIWLVGEVEPSGEVCLMDPDILEIWQSPEPQRSKLNLGLMGQVVADMKACQRDWSYQTAVRAAMQRAVITWDAIKGKQTSMDDIRQCWLNEPICTSTAVTFWQRYLCKTTEVASGRAWVEALAGVEALAVDLIMQLMPLKADRVLPGELLTTMQECGWIKIERVPRIFLPVIQAPARCTPAEARESEGVTLPESNESNVLAV